MGSASEYRVIAQDCLRMAAGAEDERDRPLWVTMAQSWIQLAEHVSRMNIDLEAEHLPDDAGAGEVAAERSQTPN